MEHDFSNFADLVSNDANLQPLMDVIEQIMAMPEKNLAPETVEIMTGMINSAFTEKLRQESVNELIKNFEEEGLTRNAAANNIQASKDAITAAIDELKPSEHKRKILNNIFNNFYDIFERALEQYHNYNFELPIKLDEGAQMPTYAHDTDACADIYASQDFTVPAHSLSNKVPTGLHIALPENWVMMIEPRSSIGFKSGLRLSNAMGIIDEDYRGEIGILYDNLSDSDYEIKAGDRIAQCWVQPVYRFKGVEVVKLPETERGEGGFGSTGT